MCLERKLVEMLLWGRIELHKSGDLWDFEFSEALVGRMPGYRNRHKTKRALDDVCFLQDIKR